MIEAIRSLFSRRGLEYADAIPFSVCKILSPRRLERLSFQPQSVIVFAVPYYAGQFPGRNLSLYALAKDYHLYFRKLSEALREELASLWPAASFAFFADASPLDEREAAARAGLGVIGEHSLLITEKYASFVFLGEILTDLPYSEIGTRDDFSIRRCEGCGRCLSACPRKGGECLSALTQKKGELSEQEKERVREGGLLWGCDTCQLVCPHAANAQITPVDFFREDLLLVLTEEGLLSMSEEEFSKRAFSWRGRKPLLRNLALFSGEKADKHENREPERSCPSQDLCLFEKGPKT